jgi:hypothetical protein
MEAIFYSHSKTRSQNRSIVVVEIVVHYHVEWTTLLEFGISVVVTYFKVFPEFW